MKLKPFHTSKQVVENRTVIAAYTPVLDFWFRELSPVQWWKKSAAIDRIIAERFTRTHELACRDELKHWRTQAHGRLAEIIVLDQFSRNLYRESPRAFAQDNMALVLAQEAIALSLQNELSSQEKAFLYLPFMHSESLAIHQQALPLFSEPGLARNLQSELQHKAIIERFKRYPHRNKVLGRQSTAEEIEFLQQPGSSF